VRVWRCLRALPLALAAWLGCAPGLRAADVFLLPRLTIEAGYDGNRYSAAEAVESAEGTAFVRASPSLDLHLLADNGTEWMVGASGFRTDYLQTGLEFREGAEAHLEGWRIAAPWGGGLRLAGGFSRDGALPDDDVRWASLAPSLRWTLPSEEWQLVASAHLDGIAYDTRLTYDGEAQRDVFAEVRLGLRWMPTRDLSVWSEAYLEGNSSNDDPSEFQGAGVELGASYWILPRGRFAASFRAGTRGYSAYADLDGVEIERNDRPMVAAVAYVHRVASWLDLFGSASGDATGSDQPDQDVDNWGVQVGATLAGDWPLFGR
jgi:hypothetical protein